MAYSVSKAPLGISVFGNQRVWQGVVSADAASGVVSFGMSTVNHVQWSPVSMATVGVRVRINASASGAVANGTVGVSGAASGDDLYMIVFGR